MKRDMELVRKIAFAIEDSPTGYAPDQLDIEGHTQEQIGYHIHLMVEAGLVNGGDTTTFESTGPDRGLLPSRY